jgi:curved DNA-binding protein CbpA
MVTDPYEVLGVPPDADDDTIRLRYLELVKQFPPDHHGERFNAIRQAYEQLKDLETRLHRRLFDLERGEGVGPIIDAIEKAAARPRPGLADLLEMSKRS